MGRFDFGMGWDGQRWREFFGIQTPQQEEDLKKAIKSVLEEMETPLENNHAINHVQFIDLTGSPEYQVSYPLTDEELDIKYIHICMLNKWICYRVKLKAVMS